jgi:hypothetical protein
MIALNGRLHWLIDPTDIPRLCHRDLWRLFVLPAPTRK